MTSRKAMTAMRVALPVAPSTRMGESSHFQKGMPPSTGVKPPAVSMIRLPLSSGTRA